MKFYSLLLLLCFFTLRTFAQNGTVQGFVVDKETKLRLAKVYIYNATKDEGIYNTPKGEFTIKAAQGDTLFAVLQGYAVDTLVHKGQKAVYFQLKSLGINLREVSILGKN
jgi:putative lipase involved disintegration of autophagic bodies